jgi:hypothetical protein
MAAPYDASSMRARSLVASVVSSAPVSGSVVPNASSTLLLTLTLR